MALINPCNISINAVNTGSECDDSLKATAMIIMVPKNAEWDASDEVDFTAYALTKIHAAPSLRWYPIFGTSAPIRNITDANESDVIETMEDGSVQFIRYGMFNRTFMTDKGGLCMAQALMSLNSNYAFIEVDITGKVARKVKANGKRAGFLVNLAYAPVPTLANLKTSYKNNFLMSFSPLEYIKNGKIVASDSSEDLLSLRGLYDTVVEAGASAASTTQIFLDVYTECAESDLVALYPTALPVVGNFIVTRYDTGAVIVPTAAAVSAGQIRLTGTYPTGVTLTVKLADAATLKAAGIEGYEGVKNATVTIP